MIEKKKLGIYFLIFISLIFSLSLSIYFINLYDKYNLNGITHIMLKEETAYHWISAAKIIEQIKLGVPFYIAGEEVFTKPLHQRLIAVYSYLTNFPIIENWKLYRIALGGKLSFLFIQSFLYYGLVFYLCKQISKIFSPNVVFFIIAFLCIEPTIFQYHSSFWTESIYFSIQLLILILMLGEEKNKNFIIIGFMLGILFLQRTAGIFYVIFVIIFFFFTLKKNKYIKIFLLILSYLTICLGLGLHNFKRAGAFYIIPTEVKYGVYKYFSIDVLANAKKTSVKRVNEIETEKSLLWVKENLTNIDYLKRYSEPYEIALNIKDEKDKYEFYNYLNKRAYEILLENPLITIKSIIIKLFHFSVLDPFFIYYDNEYYKNYSSAYIGDFVFSNEAKALIPIRILYSTIIYIFVFFGMISCFKENSKIFFLILGSILYNYVISGWYGKTRLYAPILIYLSFFFGFGINYFITYLKKIYTKKTI